MNKTIFTVLIALSLLACNKKQVSENKSTPKIDSLESTEKQTETTNLVEFSPEKMSAFLASKNNDTLYITNFFATWCGPCMMEMPHFKEKMNELENQPVKFTFVSLDSKKDWNTKVNDFATENKLSKNVILLDREKLSPDFFQKNFKTYSGEGIPFTFFRKNNKTDEFMSMMTKEQLDQKIIALK